MFTEDSDLKVKDYNLRWWNLLPLYFLFATSTVIFTNLLVYSKQFENCLGVSLFHLLWYQPLVVLRLCIVWFALEQHGLTKLYADEKLLVGFVAAVPLPFHSSERWLFIKYLFHK